MSNVRHQRLVYGADGKPNDNARRTFNVAHGSAVLVASGGIAAGESVQIYHRVGSGNPVTHGGSGANEPGVDFVWTPLTRCGNPVVLDADNSQYIEKLPGLYMVGPPDVPPVFAGDVNITTNDLGKEYLYVQPYCGGDKLDEEFCPPAEPLGLLTSW